MKRTQAERTASTRAALVAAARPLFAAEGYAAVGTTAIAAAAGVTRGALYHQFGDKRELFAAVVEGVEDELMAEVDAVVGPLAAADPLAALVAAGDTWLEACARPDVERIALVEAPSVLGWERWRAIGIRRGLGLVVGLLEAAIAAGRVGEQAVLPMSHLLVGAIDEAALFVARAEDPDAARAEMRAGWRRLLTGLRA